MGERTGETAQVQWAVRNNVGKVWRYANAKAAERSRATSEVLVRRVGGSWVDTWSGPDAAPLEVLRD